jgi:hypothetical protein
MPKIVTAPVLAASDDPPVFPDDLEAKLEETLVTLSHVEHAYAQRRATIDDWTGSERQKERLHAELEKLHQKERQPLILRLADLHYRLTRMSMFRTVH